MCCKKENLFGCIDFDFVSAIPGVCGGGTLDKDVVGGSTKMDSALDLIRSAVNQAEQDGGLEGTQEVREQDGTKLQSSDNSMTSSQEGSNSDSGIVRRIGDIIDEVTRVNKDRQKLAELTECFEKLLEKRKEEKERVERVGCCT